MPSITLTDKFVAKRFTDRQTYFDQTTCGLVLRVTPASKSWVFVYAAGPKRRWLPLGSYPALSLAEARKAATEQRRLVDEGRDPVAEKKAAKSAPPAPKAFTFSDLADLYETWQKGRKKTWHEDRRKIRKYLVPAWGPLLPTEITRTHVHELLDRLVAQGMTVGVNRVQAVISRMFALAVDRSLVASHPASRMIKRFDETPGERVLTDDEIRGLWEGLKAHPDRAADAIRLRLLLGQRAGEEIVPMQWPEVDLDEALWVIPGSRTKNGDPHAVPLPPLAVDILSRRRETRATTSVFDGLRLGSDDYAALAALHGDAYSWRDLRRTVATKLAELGVDEATIGRALNHAKYTVTSRHYNKYEYLPEKRAALEAWDREVQRIIRNEPRATRVVQFQPRAR